MTQVLGRIAVQRVAQTLSHRESVSEFRKPNNEEPHDVPSPRRGSKQDESRAWWADVQHLREAAERRALDTPRHGPRPEPLTVEDIEKDLRRAAGNDAGRTTDRHEGAAGAPSPPASPSAEHEPRPATGPRAEPTARRAAQPIARRRSGPSAPREAPRAGRIALAELDPELIGLDFAVSDAGTAPDELLPGSELDLVSGVIDPEAPRRRQPRHVHRPVGQRPPRSKTPRPAPAIWLADEPDSVRATHRPVGIADAIQGPGAAVEPARRRTVQIRGRTVGAPAVPRLVDAEDPIVAPRRADRRRRQGAGVAERLTAQPDRIALWAVLMGFFLIVVAALSAHG